MDRTARPRRTPRPRSPRGLTATGVATVRLVTGCAGGSGGAHRRHDQLPADEVGLEDLTHRMAGGAERAALKHGLAQVRGVDTDELPEETDLKASSPTSS